jgi:opacity protein-like surface antigen
MRKILFAAAMAVAALTGTAMAAAPALAATNGQGALYSGNAFCHGAQIQNPANANGFVNFHLANDGTSVTLNYHIKGALANTTYYVYGYEGFCTFKAFLGQLTTNSNGVANADFSYSVDPGTTEVWTFSFGDGQAVESVVTAVG